MLLRVSAVILLYSTLLYSSQIRGKVVSVFDGGAQARPAIEDVKKHTTQAQVDAAEAKVAEWEKAHPKKP